MSGTAGGRIASGSIMTMLGEAIGSTKQLVLIPLFLAAWGDRGYGIWLTMYSLVAYLPLIDFGMQNYVVNRMTLAASAGDETGFRSILASSLALYGLLSAVGTIVLATLVGCAPLERWFNVPETGTVRAAAFLIGLYMLSGIIAGIVAGVYQSRGDYDRRMWLCNARELVLMAAVVVGLLLKTGYAAIAAIHITSQIVFITFCAIDIRRRYAITASVRNADWRQAAGFLAPGLLFLGIVGADALKVQGSVLAIGGVLGAVTVASFGIHRTLANLIYKLVGAVKNAVWPELTMMDARGQKARAVAIFMLLMKLSLAVSGALTAVLAVSGRDVIRWWTSGRIVFDPALWGLLLAYVPVTTLWEMSALYQVATNRHRLYAYAKLAAAAAGVCLAIPAASRWGSVGVVAAFFATEIILCLGPVTVRTLRLLDIGTGTFTIQIVCRGVLIAAVEVAVAMLAVRVTPQPVYGIVLAAFGVGVIGATATYFAWLSPDERVRVRSIPAALRGRWI